MKRPKLKIDSKKIVFLLWIIFLVLPGLPGRTGGADVETAIAAQQIRQATLESGLEVLVDEGHENPVVSLQLWIKAGSIFEDRLLGSGLSHFIEHLAFKGPRGDLKGAIPREVQNLGGTVNAYTSLDKTVFLVTVPSRHWREALDLLRSLVLEVDFQPEEVEKEREVILKEINMGHDDPDRRLQHLLWRTAYRVHPYRFPVIGYRELFEKVSRDDVYDYYRRWYIPNNMVLIAAGDLAPEDFFTAARESFGPFPRHPYPVADIPAEPPQVGLREAEETMDVAQARVCFTFHIPSIHSRDLFPLDVLALLAGQGDTSKLYQSLREKQGLVYSVSAYSYTPLFPGLFVIQVRTDPGKIPAVRAAVMKILDEYKRTPVSAEDLAKARARVISEHLHSLTTVEGRASDAGSNFCTAGSAEFSRYYLAGIASVTPDDIQAAAARYFREENLTIAAIKPSAAPATTPPAVAGDESPVRKTVLDDGLIVLTREDRSVPLVSIRMVLTGGVLVETDGDNGISQLVSRLLLKGTKERTALQIAREIEDYGGSISTYSARNTFGYSLEILSDRTDSALAVLGDLVKNSDFPEPEIEKERAVLLAEIEAENDDPRSLASRLLLKLVFGEHPYRFSVLGTETAVAALTRENLRAYFDRYCVARNGVLAVFGDISDDEVMSLVRRHFEGMREGEKPVLTGRFPPPPTGVREDILAKEDIKQTVVMQGYAGTDVYGRDRYALELLSSVFSGLSAPLFSRIRIEKGLAYYVGAYQILGLEPGAFIFYAGTVPGSTGEVLAAYREEIERARTGEFSPEEIERNKNRLVGEFQFGMQTNAQRAFQAAVDELYGLGYDDYRQYEERIRSLTVEDLARVAKKYFSPDNYALAVVEPEESEEKMSKPE